MRGVKSENPVFRYAREGGRDDRHGFSRREMVQQLLTGVGGSAALASLGRADSRRAQQESPSGNPSPAGTEVTRSAEWSPQFLDAHQNETLTVLAERIVPGSGKAQVNRLIDLLLSVEIEPNQRKFLQSLSAFDAEAIRRHRQPFASLTEEQQNEILTAASEGVPGQRPKEWYESDSDVANPTTEGGPMTLRNHFENMKQWVVETYYNSEVGLKDLGWTGRVMWDSFPACEHPGGHK
jgi:Gluconate 2-dehydrogenase subunit 3